MSTSPFLSKTCLLGLLLCGMVSSCGPSRDEKALAVFCRTEGPQKGNVSEYSSVQDYHCYFYGDRICLYDIYVDTREDIVELHFSLTDEDSSGELEEAFRSRGDEILLDMASGNRRFRVMLRQVQKVGYRLVVLFLLDEVVSYDRETISKWIIE